MTFQKKQNSLNVAVQTRLLNAHFPSFEAKVISPRKLVCSGKLKPTARSPEYSFELSYLLNHRPKIQIIDPKLIRNFNNEPIPHTFSGNLPCLYYKWDFNGTMIIAKTIIPWLNTWLYFYEDWHVTGKWNGGGIHPVKNKKPNNGSKV